MPDDKVPPGFFDWPSDLPWPLPPGWVAGPAGDVDVIEDEHLGTVAAYRGLDGEIIRTASRPGEAEE